MDEDSTNALITFVAYAFAAVMAFSELHGESAEVTARQAKLNDLELQTVRALHELEQETGGAT